MTLIVEKFGGTSVGSVERIQAVAEHLKTKHEQGESLVVVVSAMSGRNQSVDRIWPGSSVTRRPLAKWTYWCPPVSRSRLPCCPLALQEKGVGARSFTGSQVRILTDQVHGKARILEIDDSKIRKQLDEGRVVIVAGFQGSDTDGNITTLGRGGSDTSAVALAAALSADECRIYTDVNWHLHYRPTYRTKRQASGAYYL